MKKELKRKILTYLLLVFPIDFVAYIVLNSLHSSGNMTRTEFHLLFYGVGLLFMPFAIGWLLFGSSYVLVRRCEKCGSKNVHHVLDEGFVCDDCKNTFKLDILKNSGRLVLFLSVLFLFFGPCYMLGSVIAGEVLDNTLVFFGILLSACLPSVVAVFVYLLKFMNKSEFLNEHSALALTLFFTLFIMLSILMLMVYWWIILEIFKVLGIPI